MTVTVTHEDTISSDSVPEITEKLLFSSLIAITHRKKYFLLFSSRGKIVVINYRENNH